MIAPALIAEILGLGASVRTVGELESAVSAGLPKSALERLSARRLSVDESARTERLARVLASAEYVWDDGSRRANG
jgi:uncharacterized protein (DUF2384 family)